MTSKEAIQRYGLSVGKALAGLVLPATAKSLIDLATLSWQEALKKSADATASKSLVASKQKEVLKHITQYLESEDPDANLDPAIYEAADTLEAAVLASDNLFYLTLAQNMKSAGRLPKLWEGSRQSPLDRREADLVSHHDLLLTATAEALFPLLEKLPGFTNWFVGYAARGLLDLDSLDNLQKKILGIQGRTDAEFERNYRAAVVREHNKVELFIERPDVPQEGREQTLTVAYVSLTLTHGREDISSSSIAANRLLDSLETENRRVFVVGKAGSGKTTLLRWAAVQAASGALHGTRRFERVARAAERAEYKRLVEADPRSKDPQFFFPGLNEHADRPASDWTEKVPLLIRLRNWESNFPPTAEDFHKDGIGDQVVGPPVPSGWAQRVLDAGRGLMLLDGLDELSGPTRKRALKWIAGLAAGSNEDNVFLTSSRPAAVEEGALKEAGFDEYEVANLSREGKIEFVDRWHEAVKQQLGENADRLGDLEDKRTGLLKTLDENPAVSRLAENPLLCALLCALNRLYRQSLPQNLHDLCASACKMLLWDRDALIGLSPAVFPKGYRDLNYVQRRHVTQWLAYEMVKADGAILPRESAVAHVRAALGGPVREDDTEADEVLDGLLQRSGLLRPAGGDDVEFVHNTLRDFLAAAMFAGRNEFRLLVRKLDSEGPQRWEPIILFAAATESHWKFAQALLTALLNSRAVAGETWAARRLVALKAEARMQHRPTPELQERAEKLRAKMLPVDTFQKAEAIAEGGEAALEFLDWTKEMPEEEAAACVHALARIDCDLAKERLCNILRNDHRPRVLNELLEALSPEQVASEVDLLEIPVVQESLQAWKPCREIWRGQIRDFSQVAKLVNADTLNLSGTHMDSIAPLSNWLRLERLALCGGSVTDLSPLIGMGKLRGLVLNDSRVTDLSPLAQLTRLRELHIKRTKVTDLSPLAGLAALELLDLGETPVTDLSPLTGLPALQMLGLDGTHVTKDEVERLQAERRVRKLPEVSISRLLDQATSGHSGLGKPDEVTERAVRHLFPARVDPQEVDADGAAEDVERQTGHASG